MVAASFLLRTYEDAVVRAVPDPTSVLERFPHAHVEVLVRPGQRLSENDDDTVSHRLAVVALAARDRPALLGRFAEAVRAAAVRARPVRPRSAEGVNSPVPGAVYSARCAWQAGEGAHVFVAVAPPMSASSCAATSVATASGSPAGPPRRGRYPDPCGAGHLEAQRIGVGDHVGGAVVSTHDAAAPAESASTSCGRSSPAAWASAMPSPTLA